MPRHDLEKTLSEAGLINKKTLFQKKRVKILRSKILLII
jgi:hypothetical protein